MKQTLFLITVLVLAIVCLSFLGCGENQQKATPEFLSVFGEISYIDQTVSITISVPKGHWIYGPYVPKPYIPLFFAYDPNNLEPFRANEVIFMSDPRNHTIYAGYTTKFKIKPNAEKNFSVIVSGQLCNKNSCTIFSEILDFVNP